MDLIPVQDVMTMAQAVAKSGLFGAKSTEQALSLMLIAQAEGRHPALAARDYDIINGRPAKKAEAMLRDFLAGGGKVEWHQLDDTIADATFSHPQGGSARISWDMVRAKKAELGGKGMWLKYPRQMLRSRTVSEGVRTVWPSATSGMYVPEEVRDFEPLRGKQIKDVTPEAEDVPRLAYAAPHSPTDGALENLPEDRVEIVRRIAQAAIEMIEAGALDDAYVYLYEENLDEQKVSNDEFVAIWALLKTHSKARSALKRMRQERALLKQPAPADDPAPEAA